MNNFYSHFNYYFHPLANERRQRAPKRPAKLSVGGASKAPLADRQHSGAEPAALAYSSVNQKPKDTQRSKEAPCLGARKFERPAAGVSGGGGSRGGRGARGAHTKSCLPTSAASASASAASPEGHQLGRANRWRPRQRPRRNKCRPASEEARWRRLRERERSERAATSTPRLASRESMPSKLLHWNPLRKRGREAGRMRLLSTPTADERGR